MKYTNSKQQGNNGVHLKVCDADIKGPLHQSDCSSSAEARCLFTVLPSVHVGWHSSIFICAQGALSFLPGDAAASLKLTLGGVSSASPRMPSFCLSCHPIFLILFCKVQDFLGAIRECPVFITKVKEKKGEYSGVALLVIPFNKADFGCTLKL